MPMIKNPHPDAGKGEHYQTVGCIHECLPCLVKSRSEWAQRSLVAEKRVRELETNLRELQVEYTPQRNMKILRSLVETQALQVTGLPTTPNND